MRELGNFRKFVNYLCQSAVAKFNIATWCCKISMFLTNNDPDIYALTFFRKMACFSAALRNIILANSNENYRRYNFQAVANISGKFQEKFAYNFYYSTSQSQLCKRCICYGRDIRLSVRPSVSHTPVLCQNEETQKDAIFTTE